MPTREVYQISQSTGARTYAGYARFGSDGSFQGTAGGYSRNTNNANNRASRVQNVIATSGARQAQRTRRAFGG